jgi:hypothetical protein
MSRIRAILCISVLALINTSAQALVLPWYNGGIQSPIGQDLACNTTIVETRVSGYAGQTYIPPNWAPAVGEVFYAHLVLAHPGNPCSGSAVAIELLLPSGVNTAISANDPVFCYARVPANQSHGILLLNLDTDLNYGCPQVFGQGLQGLAIRAVRGGVGAGLWGMFQGSWLEILVPLKATTPQLGNNSIYFRVSPDVGVVGYPSVPALADGDVLFRSHMEDNGVTLDICTVTPIAPGC